MSPSPFPRKQIQLVNPSIILGHVLHEGILYKALYREGEVVTCQELTMAEFEKLQRLIQSFQEKDFDDEEETHDES